MMKQNSIANKTAKQVGEYHLNTGSNCNKHLPIKTFLLVNLFLFSVTQALIAQVSFNTATSIGVGTNPRSLTVTDINLDGKPDLLTANYNSNDVSVRFGNGLGGFSGTTSISVGTNPRGLTVADINLDGNPDLLVANENSNSVSVRIGDGAGGFSGTTEIAVQTNPINVVVSDVNLDGKPDLLANNYNSNTVSVRLGDGLGGFSGSTNIAVGNAPISLTVTDINLDGKPDILVSRIGAGNNAVSVRLGDGLGGFTGTTNILVGSFPYKVVVADMNSDGKPDFLTSNLGGNTVSVRLGDGVGGFSGSTEVTVGSGPISIAVGDVNSDSKPDFVVANRFGNNISVGLGDGTGAFNSSSVFAVGIDPWGIILADVNADGAPDVLTANQNSNDASVLLNTSSNFITQWNLATPGSGATQLTFGTGTSGTVNYTWQEISPGSATGSGSWSGATLTITGLPAGATIRLQIAPINFESIYIAEGSDRNRLTQVEQWGSTAWTSMQRAFSGCENLQVTATDVPNLSGVADMSYMFFGCINLNSPSNITTWNTSSVIDMSILFGNALAFNQNIGAWNTGAVTNMNGVFSGAQTFNQDIGAWNTSAVTNMAGMFGQAPAFNQNIGSWNTAAVTNMQGMFSDAITFNNGGNASINNWNTGAVTKMNIMFRNAAAFNQNISSWNTGAVTNMVGMFGFASTFNQNIGAWNTGAVTNMQEMFSRASAFNNGGNGSINNWNTSAVTSMVGMFSQAQVFNQNIGSWNTSAVTDMLGMFFSAQAFNQNIGSWNTGAVTNMTGLFQNAIAFNNGGNASINNWNTGAVTSMGSMFRNATAFNQNIGAWNTGVVTDMSFMFAFNSAFNQNLGSWNTGAVTNMSSMFNQASSFNQNVGSWTLKPGVNLANMLDNSGMDCNNYSATLMGWSANPLTPNGRTLGAIGRQYGTNAVAARTNLTTTKGWTITGDTPSGAVCGSVPAPTIASFTPTSGPIGTTVTIAGTNFSTTPANNIVKFNGTTAVVTASTATSISTSVPAGATTGTITVTVAGITATSATNFTVTQNFITQWNLATAGSGPTELSFGTATSGTVNYTWQEISPGSATGSGSWSGSTLAITGLPVGATIRLQIAPTNFQRIIIDNGLDSKRLILVTQWGNTSWTSMSNAFSGCENLVFLTATDVPNLLGVTSMSSMFSGCKNLSSPSNINTWNTSSVTDMSSLFSGALGFNQNIGAWNTSSVTDMSSMFSGDLTFNQNIGSWNTAAVTNMAAMFKQTNFNNGGNGSINNWNTAAVTDMSQMFLASPFNQNIGAWNTGAVTLMWKMFSASSFNQNIGAWNTGAVTNMLAMFELASTFNNGGNSSINNWNTAAVTDMASMFYGSPFNQNIGSWNTAAVANMQGMFGGASAFNQNIGAWNTGAVTNMSSMFSSASAFNQNIGAWNTGAVTDMSCMFCFTSAFNQNIGSWNTAAATNMQQVFFGATAFNQNLAAWTLNPAVNMVLMLENSGMDCNNYSATLIGWSANPLTPNGRTLGSTGRQYGTNAVAARTNLTTTKGWTIAGDTPSGAVCGSVPAPTISDFNPKSASSGATITIDGTNFTGTTAVTFGGTAATSYTVVSAIKITAVVGSGSSGSVAVTTPGGTASLAGFTFVPALTITISPQPNSASVCDGTTASFTIAASGTTNIAYQWQKFNGTIFTDVNNGAGYSGATSTAFNVNTTGNFGAGDYRCKVSGDLALDVFSNMVILTVNPVPTAPTLPVNGNSCGAGVVSVSVSGGANGQYVWYTAASGGTAIAGEVNSSYTTPSISITTDYFASLNIGGCESATRTKVTATINSIPPVPSSPISGSSCGAGTVTVSVSGGTNGQYRWYTLPTGGTAIPGETNSSYTTPSISATTLYYAAINNGTCESSRTLVTATINPIPSTPTPTPISICTNSAGNLTAAGAVGTQEYRWYDTNVSIPVLFTGTTFAIPSLAATRDYFVSIIDPTTTCESTRASVAATALPLPSPPTIPVQPAPACGPSAVIPITATGGTAGQYRWYTVASGGTAIPGEINAAYSPTVTSTPANFFVAINDGTCESTRTSVTANLINTPAPTTTGSSACPSGIFTLTASGGTNGQYKWYTDATGGTPITGAINGSFTTAALSSTTTFYVTNTASGCESARTPVTATVITSGCAPNIPAQTYNLPIEGKVEVDLKQLITTSGILDVSTIKVIKQPASGASAEIVNGVLIIDYKGKPFVGREIIVIEACTTTGQCSQQTFEIDVAGDIVVFNGISPNGDGLNDFLTIQNIELLPETKNNTVMIYSRWGDEVFKVSDYNNKDRAFKGDTNNGNKLPNGTYFYKIMLPNAGKTKTGFIKIEY